MAVRESSTPTRSHNRGRQLCLRGVDGSQEPAISRAESRSARSAHVVLIVIIVVAVFSPWIVRYPYAEPHFSDTLPGAQ